MNLATSRHPCLSNTQKSAKKASCSIVERHSSQLVVHSRKIAFPGRQAETDKLVCSVVRVLLVVRVVQILGLFGS